MLSTGRMWLDDSGQRGVVASRKGLIGFVSVGNHLNNERTLDNVRVIPESGYFISQTLNAGSSVEWCTLNNTVTLTSAARTDSETVTIQTSTNGGTTWNNLSSAAITSPDSNTIQYKATLQTRDTPTSGIGTDPYFSDFPTLEDVTITYMDKVDIRYWREGAQ